MSEQEVKQQVRQFYDQVGWQQVSEGLYQNARYEDLRPVSKEYIHRCHLRLNRWLRPSGRYLLDAGSGPVQYPEYLTYSEGYQYRVCLDLSIVALQEARQRLQDRGLYVVADVANLPFAPEVFEGEVSLHTFHHLPLEDQERAYRELFRTLAPGCTATVVNGWTDSPLMRRWNWLATGMESVGKTVARLRGKGENKPAASNGSAQTSKEKTVVATGKQPTGTFIKKLDATWLKIELPKISPDLRFEIRVWRCVSVRFLRAVMHQALGGQLWLRLLFALEEKYPHYFGENGQYPLIILKKLS